MSDKKFDKHDMQVRADIAVLGTKIQGVTDRIEEHLTRCDKREDVLVDILERLLKIETERRIWNKFQVPLFSGMFSFGATVITLLVNHFWLH